MDQNKIALHVQLIDRYIPNEDLAIYFSAADLVVQPYRSASGSAVSQLAYSFDRPVIATRVGSLPEVIEDGINGRLVEPEDTEGLANAIVESLRPQTLERLSHNACQTKEKFNWKKIVEIIEQKNL